MDSTARIEIGNPAPAGRRSAGPDDGSAKRSRQPARRRGRRRNGPFTDDAAGETAIWNQTGGADLDYAQVVLIADRLNVNRGLQGHWRQIPD